MKILSANFYNTPRQNFNGLFKKTKHTQQAGQKPLESNEFINNPLIRAQIFQEEDYFISFLESKGKVNKKEYDEIIKNHKRTLVKAINRCQDSNIYMRANPETHAKIALDLKDYYDKKYKDYTIISIGTSPAMIAETMQNLGSNVIFLPITNFKYYQTEGISPIRNNNSTFLSRFPNLQLLMRYATKKGIAKKNTGELIVLDYSCHGTTLQNICKLLEERGDIPKEKIHPHSIIADLDKILYEHKHRITEKDVRKLEEDLICSRVEKISNVPHFDIAETFKKSPRKMFKEFDDFSQPNARAWSLCTLHEVMKIKTRENQ